MWRLLHHFVFYTVEILLFEEIESYIDFIISYLYNVKTLKIELNICDHFLHSIGIGFVMNTFTL